MDPPEGRSISNNSSNNSSSSSGRSRLCKNWEKYLYVVIVLQSIAIIVVFEKFHLQNNVKETLNYGQEEIKTRFEKNTQHHHRDNDDPNENGPNNDINRGNGIQDRPLPFSFSACLLIKDNNILLPEWLAYHYTVLPLRRLIVGVDPLSHTDPKPIFDSYGSIGMNITTWTNDSFWVDGYQAHEKKNFPITNQRDNEVMKERFVYRQEQFYKSCMQQLHDENQTWTVLVDTDEYLAFNYYDEQEGPPTWCSRKGQKPSCAEDYAKSIKDGTHPRAQLDRSPTATVAEHIDKRGVDQNWDGVDKPCVVFGRYLFMSKESSNREEIQRGLDSEFNASLFHTLRYRYRAPLSTYQLGKSIVDVSRYDGRALSNPHRPLGDLCTG